MKNFILLIIVSLCSSVFGQTLVSSFKPVDSKYNWGYLNEKGEVILEPNYKGAFDFSEGGIAPVLDLETKKWSYIDLKGKALSIDLKNYQPNSVMGYGRMGFTNGMATVIVKKKKGVINLKGDVVFSPEFDFISKFSEGFATAKKGNEFFVLTKSGTKIKVDESILVIKKFPTLKN